MKKSKKLEPVYRYSESRQQDAARLMGEGIRQLEAQQKQLDDLLRYRSEYMLKLQSRQSSPQGAVQLKDFRVFMAKLDQAIELQQQRRDMAEKEYMEKRQQWMVSRTRKRALGEVMGRHRRREQAVDERREQFEADEIAIRAVLKQGVA